MDSMSLFTENFFAMARMLGCCPGGATLELPSGAVAAASGYPSAGENYLLPAAETTGDETKEMLQFFSERSLSFAAPVFPDASEEAVFYLKEHGVEQRLLYTAMTLDLTTRRDDAGEPGMLRAATPEEIAEWGQTVWEGFGGEGKIDAAYAGLVRHMASWRGSDLYTLRDGGEAVACGLLYHDDAERSCGLYYFATKPAARRKGYARRLMAGMVREAALAYGELVLLATPAGLPFYRDFGFASLADVPMFSDSADL